MNKKIVVGNWKMYDTVLESTVLIEKLKNELKHIKNTEVVICPSFIDIYPASKELHGSNIELGAQDLFYEEQGAYTGEISPVMLSRFVKFAIVGHSERRLLFSETDKMVARKAEAAVAHNITPIICVGETLQENEDGLSKVVVMSQIETALSHLTASEVAESVVAYEPIWSIGTGRICKPTTADKMAKDIKGLVKALYGEKASAGVRVLYGGSVNEENAEQYANSKKLDGVLVGGASLDHKKFSQIVESFEHSTDSEGKAGK